MLVSAVLMTMLAAQTPIAGQIEIFGARKIPQDRILKAIDVKSDDPL